MSRREALVLAICCMSLAISGMDLSIVNLALPAIQADLHASVTDLQWVIDVYNVGVASLLILSGTTADRVGRKRMFQIGLVVFTTASVLCALAPSLPWLIAFRGLQAIGGSMLNPVALSIITSVFGDSRQRARAMGVWSGVLGLSLALGPLVGGMLIESVGWRAIFWINAPIGVAAIALTAMFVPESRAARQRRLDPIGQLLVIAVFGGITFAIIEAPRGDGVSARSGVAAVVAVLAAVAFVRYESRRPDPMIDLRLFRSRRFSGAQAIGLLSSLAFSGSLLLMGLYLQQGQGRDPVSAGLILVPMGVMTAVCAPIAGRVMGRTGPRRPVLWSGWLLTAGGAGLAAAVALDSVPLFLVGLAVFAAGFGFVNAPVNYIAADEVTRERAGLAAGMTSTARLVGAALGVAVIGSVLAARVAPSVPGDFAAASSPCWWLIAGCGIAVLGLGAATTSAGFDARQLAEAGGSMTGALGSAVPAVVDDRLPVRPAEGAGT